MHGANRLASNSLLEGLVFGARAGCAIRNDKRGKWPMEPSKVIEFDAARHRRAEAGNDPAWRAIDARIAGGEPLDAAAWREASILTVGRLIARAALRREESRGGHFRSDFPNRDDIHWKRRASETRETNSIKD